MSGVELVHGPDLTQGQHAGSIWYMASASHTGSGPSHICIGLGSLYPRLVHTRSGSPLSSYTCWIWSAALPWPTQAKLGLHAQKRPITPIQHADPIQHMDHIIWPMRPGNLAEGAVIPLPFQIFSPSLNVETLTLKQIIPLPQKYSCFFMHPTQHFLCFYEAPWSINLSLLTLGFGVRHLITFQYSKPF